MQNVSIVKYVVNIAKYIFRFINTLKSFVGLTLNSTHFLTFKNTGSLLFLFVFFKEQMSKNKMIFIK